MHIPSEVWSELIGHAVVLERRSLPQLMRVNKLFYRYVPVFLLNTTILT